MRRRLAHSIVATATFVATAVVGAVVTAGPAGAVSVSTEAQLQTAFADPTETEIVLANSIDLTCGGGGDLDRNSAAALTVQGAGFTIRQTCAGEGVMEQDGAGALTMVGVTLTGGTATATSGGAIATQGDVVVTSSTISGNSTVGSGGGIFGLGVTVTDSTISGNQATNDGGGIAANDVTLLRATISGNSGGFGGGFRSVNGPIVTNSTISGNTASNRGGGFAVSSSDGGSLVYSTVVENTSATGANISDADGVASFGSVVALPQGGGENCAFTALVSNGFNFSDDDSCGLTDPTDRQDAGDPLLGGLASNGGPTQTRLPLAGSPLIDAIPVSSCEADGASGVTTDQRGIARPQVAGCDIGAVEIAAAAPLTVRFTG
jgi:predicted outer membrane repeat protein/parallel beta-helix repeat protein